MSDNVFTIAETVAMLRKNRGGDVLRVALATVDETKLIDVRQMFCPQGATQYQATKKGFAVSIRKLDDLIAALVAARRKAIELGWVLESTENCAGRMNDNGALRGADQSVLVGLDGSKSGTHDGTGRDTGGK
jgi:hypothetical protein